MNNMAPIQNITIGWPAACAIAAVAICVAACVWAFAWYCVNDRTELTFHEPTDKQEPTD